MAWEASHVLRRIHHLERRNLATQAHRNRRILLVLARYYRVNLRVGMVYGVSKEAFCLIRLACLKSTLKTLTNRGAWNACGKAMNSMVQILLQKILSPRWEQAYSPVIRFPHVVRA